MYTLKIGSESYTSARNDLLNIEFDFNVLSHTLFLQKYYELFCEVAYYEDDFPFDVYGNLTGFDLSLYHTEVVRKQRGYYEFTRNVATDDVSIKMLV